MNLVNELNCFHYSSGLGCVCVGLGGIGVGMQKSNLPPLFWSWLGVYANHLR